MTENTNPKPFNIGLSRQKCSVEQLYWVYQSISQSINRSIPSNWL